LLRNVVQNRFKYGLRRGATLSSFVETESKWSLGDNKANVYLPLVYWDSF
jgi:hypothetical protein